MQDYKSTRWSVKYFKFTEVFIVNLISIQIIYTFGRRIITCT